MPPLWSDPVSSFDNIRNQESRQQRIEAPLDFDQDKADRVSQIHHVFGEFGRERRPGFRDLRLAITSYGEKVRNDSLVRVNAQRPRDEQAHDCHVPEDRSIRQILPRTLDVTVLRPSNPALQKMSMLGDRFNVS